VREKRERERERKMSDGASAEAELLKKLTITDGKVTELAKAREEAALTLADLYANRGSSDKLVGLLEDLKPFFSTIPKAKTAKIVRAIIDAVSKIPGTTELQLKLCREQAAWARSEKRTFLRQRIETRLATLLFATRDYQGALSLISTLLSEVKRLDDKLLLVDIHLLESRVHHALRNLPKSKAALTAARTAANAIYVPPAAQAEIDCQSGTLHAEEKDYKTAYSYFYEGFEQYSSVDESKAGPVLKYMLLCKIMSGNAEDVAGIVNTKAGLKYSNIPGVNAMLEIAEVYKQRSIQAYQAALEKHKDSLTQDLVVMGHLQALYEKMLEQNILRIIEPYSQVEVDFIASQLSLDKSLVERKLSTMILDGIVFGTLENDSSLIVYDKPSNDAFYKESISTIENISHAVDVLTKVIS